MKRIAVLLFASCSAPDARPPEPVHNGIDVLEAEGFASMRDAAVGLITNHTGRTFDGRSIIDTFLAADALRLVAIFSPEHGIAGNLERSRIDDSKHASGVPIYSLYGETRKPTTTMLDGIDTLVFDIQDIGCRFYTYIATMRLAMEAAAEHSIRFVVLDRPNPIGGELVDGPVLDAGDESFVGYHTVAVQHGMTAGELARMMNDERAIGCELRVVEMRGWRRDMMFDATLQSWVDPSPNMRNPNQALLYPGVGLLETTNLSVGRGTDTPFERIGAPWLDGLQLASRLNSADVPGVRFVPVTFTPEGSKFAGEPCSGVHLLITDRDAVRPLRLGMHLAATLRSQHRGEWQPDRYPRLLADRAVFEALLAGATASELEALWQAELAEFRARRAKYLRY